MMISQMVLSMALTTVANLGMEVDPWRSINDGVMGGLSAGGMVESGRSLKFKGNLSLENNGGFSSVRRLVSQDLSSASRVRLKVRGDGRDYQFRIRHGTDFDGVSWRASFPTSDDWQTVEISFDQLVPVWRGRKVPQAGPVVPSKIDQVGFLLADKKPGRFELEVRQIEFLGPDVVANLD